MERPRILVVEDDPCGRELLALIFEREDYDVIEVANGAEALSMVGRDKIDLIFLDLSLPTMIGDEVVRRIKADPRTARIPVIVNTAFDSDTEIVKYAIAAGADQICTNHLISEICLQRLGSLSVEDGGRKINSREDKALVREPPITFQLFSVVDRISPELQSGDALCASEHGVWTSFAINL